MKHRRRVPSYCLHRPSGQAFVTLNGRQHYLGPHGTEVSKAEYDRLVSEWLANGRRSVHELDDGAGRTVNELLLAYWDHVDGYHQVNGEKTSEWYQVRTLLRLLRELYGPTPAVEFGPLALKACRQVLVERGVSRKTVNHYMARMKRVFKWAVANELLPARVFQALQAVDGLRQGRTTAPEAPGVGPVDEDDVEATLPHLPRPVAAMVRLQLLTGMRPGEAVRMRLEDLNRNGPVWLYHPPHHKNAHRGHDRSVPIGPQGQKVLWPFLVRCEGGWLFSPKQSEERRNAKRRKNKRAKKRRAPKRKRPWGERYDTASYRRAIVRACRKAGAEKWTPHQLRHTAATRLRREFGIEVARVVLGHRSAAVTEIYAEVDQAKAVEVIGRVG